MKSLLFLTRMARMKKSFSLVLFSLLVLASCEGSSSSSLSSSEAKKYVVSTAHDYYSYAVTTSFQFLREEGEVAPSDVYDEITSDFALGSRYMDTNLSYGGIQVNAKTLSEEEGTFEIDKAFYDILMHMRDVHNFEYGTDRRIGPLIINDKCKDLAKKVKELIDTQSCFADWMTNPNVHADLNQKLWFLLEKNGYPPEWSDDVFDQVLGQVENYKVYQQDPRLYDMDTDCYPSVAADSLPALPHVGL